MIILQKALHMNQKSDWQLDQYLPSYVSTTKNSINLNLFVDYAATFPNPNRVVPNKQCDQMARLVGQYLAIYNNEICPIA